MVELTTTTDCIRFVVRCKSGCRGWGGAASLHGMAVHGWIDARVRRRGIRDEEKDPFSL